MSESPAPEHAPQPAGPQVHGRAFWQGLRELSDEPAVRRWLEEHFPSQLQRFSTDLGRREFLQLMGASLSLAGLTACTRQPDEPILAFAKSPEERIPGKPLHFATAMTLGSDALGLLVESHEGRPTKIEGNPDHPASLGATNALAQAAILSLYDPDRSQVVLQAGVISTWDAFLGALRAVLEAGAQGDGLRILTPAVLSPTLGAQLRAFLERHPKARWHQYEPLHDDNALEGARLAFGRDLTTRYRLAGARTILALDADFLGSGLASVRLAREFADGRRVRSEQRAMNRLYALESTISVTGAAADHRLALAPAQIERFARRLARELGLEVDAGPELGAEELRLLGVLARELRENEGASVVIAGEAASPAVHALAHWMNTTLGNVGRTVQHLPSHEERPESHARSIAALAAEMRAGKVRALLMLGGNPVFDAPADLDFAAALLGVPFRAHLSLHEDETSRLCHWHLPEAHFLESWSDARAADGTLSIVQPLIAPLYGGRSAHEIVAALDEKPGASAHQLVRQHWRAMLGLEEGADFDNAWRTALHDGLLAESASAPLAGLALAKLELGPAPASPEGLALRFQADPCVHDGRFANNGWLQELPRPLTRLVWDNALLVAPLTAQRLGLANEEIAELGIGERRLSGPVWVTAGHPEDVVTVQLGLGRTRGGRVAEGVGFDAYPLRTTGGMWWAAGLALAKGRGRRLLASVQDHRRMEGRDIVRHAELSDYESLASGIERASKAGEYSLLETKRYEPHSWGMVVDLTSCIGCNACMIACQAENNVPVVGKSEVANGREMHWMRVDLYLEGPEERPEVLHQPVMCMHCETAPCEVVCPVGATVHGPEGLNEMVYNRCVGTRYCSNNCPYKVRRFNFFGYGETQEEVLTLGRNPDVTVRSRGVMEKCTYCVQRIQEHKIEAKVAGRALRRDEVRTACQQVCPSQAIVFGDLNDPESRVSELRGEPTHYGLLAELGTRPHTTYLAKLRNPSPELG